MARQSTLRKLDPEIRQELIARIELGAETIDEMLAWLVEEKDVIGVSRSALGRFVQRVAAKKRAVAVVADAVADLDSIGTDEVVDLMMELATLRLREVKILDRLRALKVV